MALVVISATYGFLVGSRAHLVAAAVSVIGWPMLIGVRGFLNARQMIPGLDRIAWGMGFFLLAAVISLCKTGLPRRWFEPKHAEHDRSLARQGLAGRELARRFDWDRVAAGFVEIVQRTVRDRSTTSSSRATGWSATRSTSTRCHPKGSAVRTGSSPTT